MTSQQFTTIYKTDVALDIQLVKLKLDEAQIPSTISNAHLVDLLPFLSQELALRVSIHDELRAREVLKHIDINKLEHALSSEYNGEESFYSVNKNENSLHKAIFILIIVFSLMISYKYLKLF